jgi:2-keto-4-pentenoate hydratase/2-oxohepta-3-ene-1,7-dioic acid hydratase in catechol pathway
MRLVSYLDQGVATWGVLDGSRVIPSAQLGKNFPSTLMALIADAEAFNRLSVGWRDRSSDMTGSLLTDLDMLPCIQRPGKVICLGVNYIDHAKEGGNQIGDYPAVFLRCSTSLLAHRAPLKVPSISDKLDFEAELAVVIGRAARHVSEQEALSAVFGYACFNDATLRDYQRKTSQWTVGKNFDATGAFGPCLVTSDELPAGCVGLHIESRLNGQVMQSANTADMAFGVARTVSLLSESMTLEPGDVLVMGTPGGVGYARTPPVWMKAGDTIEVEIEGVGVLSNPVTL